MGAHHTTSQARIFTALFLTGILSIGSGLTLIKSSNAAAVELSPETTNEVLKGNLKQNQLPRPVVNAVLQDLSKTRCYKIYPREREFPETNCKLLITVNKIGAMVA